MSVEVVHGDARRVLAGMADGSVDAVVCDPPYELGFMGKAWDSVGVAYDVRLWGEVLRVLKPGGHLLAFGGTRTYHRMAVAIEDAGFEVRDSVHWLYGSGFPKSLDVSKAINKAAGAEREVVGTKTYVNGGGTSYELRMGERVEVEANITAPATDAARQWSGWGTALKPAHEPIVVARKPLAGTVAGNVLAYGTGALNIDGCRVGLAANEDPDQLAARSGGVRGFADQYVGGKAKGAPPTDMTAGRWPANLVFTHAADCGEACVAGCPVAELDGQSGVSKDGVAVNRNGHDPDRQGYGGGWGTAPRPDQGYGGQGGASRFFTVTEWDPTADVPPFRYVAKPSKRERNAGLDGLPEREWKGNYGDGIQDNRPHTREGYTYQSTTRNTHPTVKPVALMRWLVRLVTPPGGTVLDPFAGSGTTLVAAVLEGFDAIGIEMTDDYLPIIAGRVAWAEKEAIKATPTLFDQEAQP